MKLPKMYKKKCNFFLLTTALILYTVLYYLYYKNAQFPGDICCLAVCNYCQFLAADGNFIFVDIT